MKLFFTSMANVVQTIIDNNKGVKLDLRRMCITDDILANLVFPNSIQRLWLDFNQITSIDDVVFPEHIQRVWLIGNQIPFGIKRNGWIFDDTTILLTKDEYKRYIIIKYRICRRFIKRLRLSIIKDKLPFKDCNKIILGFM